MDLYKNQHIFYNYLQKNYFNTQLSKLEITIWLHSLGRSLISVFIPIILYTIGFSITQIILFYLLYNVINLPMNFVSRRFIIWIGAKYTIIIGLIFETIYFITLYFANLTWNTLILLALTWAIYDTFYWVSHWFILDECLRRKKGIGKQFGALSIGNKIGGIIAPAIGAAILIFLNKNYLILLSIVLFILAIIPLTKIKLDYMVPRKVNTFKEFFKTKENKINYISSGLSSFHSSIESVILPLFVFITFKSIGAVGALAVIASFASIIMIYYVGRLSDKSNKRVLISIGAGAIALIWLARLLFPEIIIIYITTFIAGLMAILIMIPLDSKLLEDGRKSKAMLDVSTYRNVSLMSANILLYGGIYLAIEVFKVSFIIAIASAILLFFVSVIFRNSK